MGQDFGQEREWSEARELDWNLLGEEQNKGMQEYVKELLAMYQKYGFYREGLHTVTLKGMEGAARIQEIMERLRTAPPRELGGMEVLAVRDYQKGIRTDRNTGETTPLGLPSSNVLYYELRNDSWCCARPSGTEPKMKVYVSVLAKGRKEAAEIEKRIAGEIEAFIMEKFAEVAAQKNKGMIMKSIMPELKGKADGSVINQVVAKLCQ